MDNCASDMTYGRPDKRKWCMRMAMTLFICHLCLATTAQTLRDAFASMPDSLVPTLTRNNRLDLMDFMDARMKAAVTNRLGGETLMTHFSSDSLCVRLSDALTIEMKMPAADTAAVVCMKRVYTTLTGERQTVLTRYAAGSWEVLSPATVVESTLRRIDEKAKSDPK